MPSPGARSTGTLGMTSVRSSYSNVGHTNTVGLLKNWHPLSVTRTRWPSHRSVSRTRQRSCLSVSRTYAAHFFASPCPAPGHHLENHLLHRFDGLEHGPGRSAKHRICVFPPGAVGCWAIGAQDRQRQAGIFFPISERTRVACYRSHVFGSGVARRSAGAT